MAPALAHRVVFRGLKNVFTCQTLWPEQKVYELLRPVVLFNESATERAKETGAAERSVRRKAGQFEEHGMASLFEQVPKENAEERSRSLPPDMRQLIVDLKAEHAGFRPNEMATICFFAFWPQTLISYHPARAR